MKNINNIITRKTADNLFKLGELKNPHIAFFGGDFTPSFTVGETRVLVQQHDGNIISFKHLKSARSFINKIGFELADIHEGKE